VKRSIASMVSAERRQEPRHAAAGTITILFADPIPTIVEGHVVDASSNGFRLAHTSGALVAGLNVDLRYEGKQYQARIIWTHIQNGHRLSGCMLLREEADKA
jgi:hypothetical protein